MKIRTTISNILREAGIGIALVLLIIIFVIAAPFFGTANNFKT